MAGLQTSIQLQDRMSAVLNNITSSMAAMLNTFEAAQAATDKGVDAAMMDSARQGIIAATAELTQYQEELERAAEKKNTISCSAFHANNSTAFCSVNVEYYKFPFYVYE